MKEKLNDGSMLRGGTYKIIRFIGQGGFGCTYEAEHVMLEKRVAIKEFFVKDFCNRDGNTHQVTVGTISKKPLVEKLRMKFVEEAKALCKMQHPGIVKTTDVFEDNGTAYFVMDYVDGLSLEEVVKINGPLSEGKVRKYMLQLADAMRYVHSKNRLHLDIKPGNILLDKNDNVVLIDFGASKQYDEVDGENTSTLMGKTPGYAPIEQMGNSITIFTPATDIYAIGATMYKLLTGERPLEVTRIADGEDLTPLPASISSGMRNAVNKSMSLRKKDRPQTIDEFVALLSAGNAVERDDATVVGVSNISEETQMPDSRIVRKAPAKPPVAPPPTPVQPPKTPVTPPAATEVNSKTQKTPTEEKPKNETKKETQENIFKPEKKKPGFFKRFWWIFLIALLAIGATVWIILDSDSSSDSEDPYYWTEEDDFGSDYNNPNDLFYDSSHNR